MNGAPRDPGEHLLLRWMVWFGPPKKPKTESKQHHSPNLRFVPLQEINISHLQKREQKSSNMPYQKGDMLILWKGIYLDVDVAFSLNSQLLPWRFAVRIFFPPPGPSSTAFSTTALGPTTTSKVKRSNTAISLGISWEENGGRISVGFLQGGWNNSLY